MLIRINFRFYARESYELSLSQRVAENSPPVPSQITTNHSFQALNRHYRLEAHPHKLKAVKTSHCTCQSGHQTPKHILQAYTVSWPQEEIVGGK